MTSIQGVPDLVTLLILVLLGKLLAMLDNVGALGFASSLYSENLKDIYLTFFYFEYYLGLHSLLGPEVGVLCLPLPPLQDCLWHCRQFAYHSHPGF